MLNLPYPTVKLPDCQQNWEKVAKQEALPWARYEAKNENLTPPHTGGGQEARFNTSMNIGGASKLVSYGTRGTDAGIQILRAGYWEINAAMLEYANATGRCDSELRINNFTIKSSLDYFYNIGEYRMHNFYDGNKLKIGDTITVVSTNANFFEHNTWTWCTVRWMGV